jgi:ADP-ribose pyrophosphatase
MHPKTRTIHRGRKFDLELVATPGPGGEPIEREVVRHPGAVCILPLLDSPRRVVMVRNQRIAVGSRILELPAGTLEPMEKPEECAPRELEEETGYAAAHLAFLGKFYTSPGMSDEMMWAFVATGLRHVGQRLEAGEDMSVETVEPDRALAMIDSGEIVDGKTVATLLLAQRRGLLGQ